MTAAALLAAICSADPDAARFAKWEKDVAAIEKRLRADPPPAGAVVFAGSSSIAKWKLNDSFLNRGYANVGFGGSHVRDCTHFADRLIAPLKPSAVVFYAGDNDIADGRTPEQVRDDFRAFAAAVPKTRILFVSVKPSVKRWSQFETQSAANRLVKEYCGTDPRLGYIDIVPAMLGPDGKPNPALFVEDGLHLSPKGYAIWRDAVE